MLNRRVSKIAVIVAVLAVPLLGIPLLQVTIGDGSFQQLIVIETEKPIRSVKCCACRVDDESRALAEATAEPCLFDGWERTRFDDGYFAPIWCSSGSRWLWPTTYSYPLHLAILIEFKDGSRACRVVDVPPGFGKEKIVLKDLKSVRTVHQDSPNVPDR